jgi:inosine-uridine nucleoside N-ribohydrolase
MNRRMRMGRWQRAGLLPGLWLGLLVGLAAAPAAADEASKAVAAAHNGRCIIVDSDGDLDDYRAVAMLALPGRVVAIVMTEGIARPVQGAGAMERVVARVRTINQERGRDIPAIPVIPGASGNPAARGPLEPDFGRWRANAERLNGLLDTPVDGSMTAPVDIAAALRPHVKDCARISLLVIGPWTSFLRYAAEVLEKTDRIIAQGRPYPDELGGQPDGLNCIYDRDACLTAFDLLAGRQQRAGRRLRTEWVDIPGGLRSCGTAEPGVDEMGRRLYAFRPTLEWADALAEAKGLAPVLARMLRKNPEGWARTALWDDLAALYLLRPDVFEMRGGHLEPCVKADVIRGMLTRAMEGETP